VYLTLNTISPPKVVTQLPKPNKDLSGGRGAGRPWWVEMLEDLRDSYQARKEEKKQNNSFISSGRGNFVNFCNSTAGGSISYSAINFCTATKAAFKAN
jgi:hypothetical protein